MMRFYCFFWILIPFLCWGGEWDGNVSEETPNSTKHLNKEYQKQAEQMVNSGLMTTTDKSDYMDLSIPADLGHKMSQRCPGSYKNLNQSLHNYNTAGRHTLVYHYGMKEDIMAIQSNYMPAIQKGISACVNDIYVEYTELSENFAVPLAQAYNLKTAEALRKMKIFDQSFINFMNSQSSEEKIGKLNERIQAYSTFYDGCLKKISIMSGYFLILSGDHKGPVYGRLPTLEEAYRQLKDFLKTDEECYKKLKELMSFTKSDLYKKFVSLPGRCKEGDAEIEFLKKAVLLPTVSGEEVSTSPPDVLSYCKEELEKASNVCHCGKEDCSNAIGDSVLEKVHSGSKDLCGGDSLASMLNKCKRRGERCMKNCNKRWFDFKEKYKDLFFVKDFNFGSDIHTRFKTGCASDMHEIQENFRKTVRTRSPYSGEEKLRGTVLPRETNLGVICEEPFEVLSSSYKNLSEVCKETEDEKKEEKDKNKEVQGASDVGSGWGSSSSSQEDEIRRSQAEKDSTYRPDYRVSGDKEFQYSSGESFAEGEGSEDGLRRGLNLTGSNFDKAEEGYRGNNNRGLAPNEGGGYVEDYKKEVEGSLQDGDGIAGSDASSGGGIFSEGLLDAPSKSWEALTGKAKELGLKADKNLRDYLLKDNKGMLQYKHGYKDVRTSEEKREWDDSSTGIRGLPRRIREKAHDAYNKVNPMSQEEWRKRASMMTEDVDLFKVSDLLFLRVCYTIDNKEECDEPGDPEAEGRNLESVIEDTNRLAESQLIRRPSEKLKIQMNRERRGLTREQELERRLNSLKETERRAKKVRQEMGLSY